jgi:cell wall-associated NlpC family hydrolase
MRRALGARRTNPAGPRTWGFLIAIPGFLALLHSSAAASQPQSTRTVAPKARIGKEAKATSAALSKHHAKAKRHSKHVRKARPGVPQAHAQHPRTSTAARHTPRRSQQRLVARHTDPSKLIIPEGDGSPVLSIAAQYLGRPYRFGSEGNAFDCSGFVRTVFADMGVDLPHSAREIATFGDRVARDELEPGDLVFFRNARQRQASHVGIYVGDDKFVHAATRGGQVQVDSLSEA